MDAILCRFNFKRESSHIFQGFSHDTHNSEIILGPKTACVPSWTTKCYITAVQRKQNRFSFKSAGGRIRL